MCGPGSNNGQWSVLAVVACLILNVGTLMFIIAFASKQWITSKENRLDELEFGLFKACYLDLSQGVPLGDNDVARVKKCESPSDFVNEAWGTDWVPGVQVIFIFTLITAVMATVIMDVFLVLPMDNLRRKPGPPFVVLCFNIAALALGLTGAVIIIMRQVNSSVFDSTQLDWAFRLSMAAKTLFFISVMLLFVEYHRLLVEAVDRRRNRATQRGVSNAGYESTNLDGSPAQRAAHASAGAHASSGAHPYGSGGAHSSSGAHAYESGGAHAQPPPTHAANYPRHPVPERRDSRSMVREPHGATALPLEPRGEKSLTGLRREQMKYY